ncbi:Ku protein [Streptomyces sp. NPDC055955]|uniref:Ku protein n=1 Tax=Streptomyces sp. NPDC055955 TaxID=3345665 RepID=UPI0035D7E40B
MRCLRVDCHSQDSPCPSLPPLQLYADNSRHRTYVSKIEPRHAAGHVPDTCRVGHQPFATCWEKFTHHLTAAFPTTCFAGRAAGRPVLDTAHRRPRHVVQVLGFVPWQDIDPILYSRPYDVGPDGPPAERPYALLVEALARTGQAGVCKVAVRSRERIALLRPRHGILILHTLLWQDELRDPGDLAPSAPVTDRELELAEVLMRELQGVGVGQLRDEYRQALEELVAAKLSGDELAAPPEPVPAVDSMAALQESVRAARAHQDGCGRRDGRAVLPGVRERRKAVTGRGPLAGPESHGGRPPTGVCAGNRRNYSGRCSPERGAAPFRRGRYHR